jgi:hypothetical protein
LLPCCGEGTVIARRGLSLEWWTFGGLAANQTVVQYVQAQVQSPLRADNFWITLPADLSIQHLVEAVQGLRDVTSPPQWDLQQPAADLLKFGDLLPDNLLRDLIIARVADVPRARQILLSPVRIVDY